MPYIKDVNRQVLDTPTIQAHVAGPGELNYLITKLIIRYIEDHAPLRYQVINDVLGALEGAKLEFYRRVVRPFEDDKIQENGDVY